MAFRFIHTADWQIGKPVGNIPADAGAELAQEWNVDAVLVAGDAFGANEVSDRIAVHTIEALKPFAGAWEFPPGSHDAALARSVWTRMRETGMQSMLSSRRSAARPPT